MKADGGRTHLDGTRCKEGTSSLPRGFAPCCEMFAGHVATCDFDVRYEWWSGERRWVIAIADSAGGGGVEIAFCPHCGSALEPKPRRRAAAGKGQAGRRLRVR